MRMRLGEGPSTILSSTRTLPEVGRCKPVMMCNSVDLPQPEGPTMQRNSPARTFNSIPSSASSRSPLLDGYDNDTSRTQTFGSAAVASGRTSARLDFNRSPRDRPSFAVSDLDDEIIAPPFCLFPSAPDSAV